MHQLQTWQTCRFPENHIQSVTEGSTDLGLELHDLELLREIVKLLVDVHHSYRSVRHLPSLSVHFLFKHNPTIELKPTKVTHRVDM